jgi:hypothetical protein
MLLYSKRNPGRLSRRTVVRYRGSDSSEVEEGALITDTLRNRLKEQIKYIVQSCNYLETFLTVSDEEAEETYLYNKSLTDITSRELGYDIVLCFDIKNLDFKNSKVEDCKFFDLIEILIIFAKNEVRENLVSRLNNIFKEEGDLYQIHGYMIVSKENEGLRSIIPLIKEKALKDKLTQYYRTFTLSSAQDFEVLARYSADILQLLFSSPVTQKDTKSFSEKICTDIASTLTEKDKAEELSNLLSETVINAKSLSNKIGNIRHTDRTTIPIGMPNFFKLVNSKNINLIELVILSLPETYIMEQKPEELKTDYLDKYKINKSFGWVVKKSKPAEINVDDIPF